MKILRVLLIGISLASTINASHARADMSDSVRILVAPIGDGSKATVTLESGTYRVPISFENGLSWDDVRDAYTIPAAYAELLKQGRIRIYIDCNGAEFQIVRR